MTRDESDRARRAFMARIAADAAARGDRNPAATELCAYFASPLWAAEVARAEARARRARQAWLDELNGRRAA